MLLFVGLNLQNLKGIHNLDYLDSEAARLLFVGLNLQNLKGIHNIQYHLFQILAVVIRRTKSTKFERNSQR